MRKGILVLAAVVLTFPALASQPGHPLDCSDWVFVDTSLSCHVSVPRGSLAIDSPMLNRGSNLVITSEGPAFALPSITLENRGAGWNGNFMRVELVRMSAGFEQVVAYVEDRVFPLDGREDHLRTVDNFYGGFDQLRQHDILHFDPITGRLLIPVRSYCLPDPNIQCPSGYNDAGWWLMSVEGLTPLFEILQTYTPTTDALQFRVPAHPEGLRSADHFDTYWGHVADLPDFTQAQPMACHYPAWPPAPGDYLTVADMSPNPAAGTANYTVTAVTYGGQWRYGRKVINGVMSGRDPALLPGCP